MKQKSLIALILLLFGMGSQAQSPWPRKITTSDGISFTIYQPQPEQLVGNQLKGRTAVSISSKQQTEPLFGALFFTATMETNRTNRMAVLKQLVIKELKVPGFTDTSKLAALKQKIEKEAPTWELKTTLDEIAATTEASLQHQESFQNDPPAIIYEKVTSVLVFIDGKPSVQYDEKMHMNRVINTVFLIVQSGKDKKFYLQAGTQWWSAGAVESNWQYSPQLPSDVAQLSKELASQNKSSSNSTLPTHTKMVVVTQPSELIQTNGEPSFKSIAGTALLYIDNSDNDIFINTASNEYFVLLSGRWYKAGSLKGPWTYVASDQLPADFARIPPGSEKDAVLASVAGTEAAQDAIVDAQIPQTAKVERITATCTVTYDGTPEFEAITGTSLLLARNSSATVIKSGNKYYCIDNAIWFQSDSPSGPWAVSDTRPADVDKIPPSSEAYQVKYVYIYETTPQYVYVGYTPGYMGAYVYGPVVVYGTGYYYTPWYVHVYYPRPVTYGFSVHYNPFTGWSIGFHYSVGFFSFHVYYGHRYGVWGPPRYRPPYYPRYRGGIYGGRPPVFVGGDVNINIDRSNNIYAGRNGVSNSDIKRPNTPGSAGPGTKPAAASKNNLMADQSGNVFRNEPGKGWQQRDGNQWGAVSNEQRSALDNQQQRRDRAQAKNNQFNHAVPAKKNIDLKK